MSTIRQIEANRRNAQKSTGPTSVAGKAASSMNALKTGIHAKSLIIPTEKLADLEQLIDEYYQCYHPASPIGRCLVDDLIRCEWLLRRFDCAEAQMVLYQNHDKFRDPQKYPLGYSASSYSSSYSKIQYRADATRRARDRALKSLQQLVADAQTEPAPAPTPVAELAPAATPSVSPSPQTTSLQIGFVLPIPSSTPPQPESEAPNLPATAGVGPLRGREHGLY